MGLRIAPLIDRDDLTAVGTERSSEKLRVGRRDNIRCCVLKGKSDLERGFSLNLPQPLSSVHKHLDRC